ARAQRALTLFQLGRTPESHEELRKARAGLSAVAAEASRLTVEADILAAEAEVLEQSDGAGARAAGERLLTLPVLRRDHLRRARAYLRLAELYLDDRDLGRAEMLVRDGLAALDVLHGSPSAEFLVRASDPVWRLYGVAARISLARGDLAGA